MKVLLNGFHFRVIQQMTLTVWRVIKQSFTDTGLLSRHTHITALC